MMTDIFSLHRPRSFVLIVTALVVLLLAGGCAPVAVSAVAPTPADLMAQGHQALADGDPEMAIATFTRVLWLEPTNAAAYLHRGEAHYELDEYELALADVNKAFELNSWDPFVYALRSKIYQALGEHDAARADWERAVK